MVVFLLACILAISSAGAPRITIGNDTERRNLGTKKDEYCKDVFVGTEEKTDKEGNKYKAQQLVTKDQRKEAESVRSKLQAARSKDDAKKDIKTMLNKNDPMGYVSKLSYVGMPFAILLAFGILGSMVYWFSFFLEKFCCLRDTQKKPYTDSDLGRPASCVFVFGLAAIGTIVYGYIVASDFANMNSVLKCSIIAVLDEVVYGVKVGDSEWIGLINAQDPLKAIQSGLDEASEAQEAEFGDSNWIETELENLDNTNQGIYDYYSSKQVPDSPNPNTAQNAGVESLYIRDRLGPLDEEFTTTYNIKTQMDLTTRVFANAALNTEQTSSAIKLNVESIKDVLTQGQRNIQSSTDQFIDIIATAEKELGNLDSQNDLVNTGLQVFFGAQLLGALLAFLGVSFTHCTGPRPKCRVLLHLGWFIMSLMMMIGLLISTFLMPVGVMLSETCTWMQDFLVDEAEFNDKSYTFLPEDIMKKLSVCKFGDGNLSQEFEINEEMAMITDMLDSVDEMIALPDEIDLSTTLLIIENELLQIKKIQDGLTVDSDATDDDNHVNALKNLNMWADHTYTDSWQKLATFGDCEASIDQYAFDNSQCSYDPYDPDNNTPALGQEACIIIKDLSLLDQANRYAQLSTFGCKDDVETKLQSYFLSLYRYDMSRNALFGSIYDDVNALKTATDAYHNRLIAFVGTTENFKSEIAGLVAATNDPKTGLMSRFNCNFVNDSVDRVFDAICVNYVSPIFKVILCTAIASVSMFFASFFSFCLAIRYARKVRPQKPIKIKKPKKNKLQEKVRGVKKEKKKPKTDKKKEPVKKKPANKKASPEKKTKGTAEKKAAKKVKKTDKPAQ